MLNTYLVSFLDCLGLLRIHIFVKCKKTQIVFGQNIFKANLISFKSCGRYAKVTVSISFFLLLFIVNSQTSQLKKINFTCTLQTTSNTKYLLKYPFLLAKYRNMNVKRNVRKQMNKTLSIHRLILCE